MTRTETLRRSARLALPAILLLAATLRVLVALVPSMAHPDEIFQYLEQAHRLVFGTGITTWEYRYGMRSPLFPLILSLPMRAGGLFPASTGLYLLLPKLAIVLLSLGIVVAALSIGNRMSRFHGLIAAFVSAIWFELVYYGGHTLSETAATALVLPAAALLIAPERRSRVVIAGILIGLAAILRFQYLPALGTLALLSCGTHWRQRWLPLILGGMIALVIGSAIDLAAGKIPFEWLFINIRQNLLMDRAAAYGLTAWGGYPAMIVRNWGLWFIPAFIFLQPTLRRYQPLFWMALVNIAFHSLIGHKEYRFILLSVTTLVILSAIGSAEFARLAAARIPPPARRFVPLTLILLWSGTSAALALRPFWYPNLSAYSAELESEKALRSMPGLCGVALHNYSFWQTGGYSYLHRDVPMYLVRSPGETGPMPLIAGATPGFNVIIARASDAGTVPSAYKRRSCFDAPAGSREANDQSGSGRVCLFVRAGGCDPARARDADLQRLLERLDV
jgi:hypothetical protein